LTIKGQLNILNVQMSGLPSSVSHVSDDMLLLVPSPLI